MELPMIEIPIPGGLHLVAKGYSNGNYPTMQVLLRDSKGTEDLICFAEYNPEKDLGHEVCIGAYDSTHEDTAYYESYNN